MRFRQAPITAASLLVLAALSGCKMEEAPTEARNVAPQSAQDNAPPAIDIKAAPGVAFNYAYSFVLPDKSISAVQE